MTLISLQLRPEDWAAALSSRISSSPPVKDIGVAIAERSRMNRMSERMLSNLKEYMALKDINLAPEANNFDW